MKIENCKLKIHFIGIGGIGVSALAQYYLDKGNYVSGSDLAKSEITELLRKKGAKIFIGQHKKENLPDDVKMVIYSPAVPDDNPELAESLKLKKGSKYSDRSKLNPIEVLSYSEALGEITKKYFTIAVCGTHGKSTTTAMTALILLKAGLDPTVVVGTKLQEFSDSNFRLGKSKFLVIEADEWQASFLNYWPKIIVLTNIEREHLDYYKDWQHIQKTYQEFISHLPKDGVFIDGREYRIDQKDRGELKSSLKIPGEHNISNAALALSVSRYLKIPDKIAYKALSEYKGSWRRFEIKAIKIKNQKLKIISDYAHHPTEIRATLAAVKEKWPQSPVCLIFQPHQYQRTFYLFDDFVKVFREAAENKIKVIITDIYDVAGRETEGIKAQISAEKLVKVIGKNEVIYLKTEQICLYLSRHLPGLKIVVIMGAGDIYKKVEILKESC